MKRTGREGLHNACYVYIYFIKKHFFFHLLLQKQIKHFLYFSFNQSKILHAINPYEELHVGLGGWWGGGTFVTPS